MKNVITGLLLLLSPNVALAQIAISISGGFAQFDLSGTGDAPVLAGRVDMPVNRYVIAEPGITLLWPEQQFGETTTLFIPEVQFQLQRPGRLAPYVGLGVGGAFDIRDDENGGTQSDLTISGAAGLRAQLSEMFGLRVELRMRGIGDSFQGSTAEWTAGLSFRPGS